MCDSFHKPTEDQNQCLSTESKQRGKVTEKVGKGINDNKWVELKEIMGDINTTEKPI